MKDKKKRMGRGIAAAALLILAAVILGARLLVPEGGQGPSEEAAAAAAKAYADAVDYDYEDPAVIYEWMTNDYKASISEADFVAAFNKERSYPYLTPLFIYYDRVEMDGDYMRGTAYYTQAARLPGMVYEVGLVYEDGGYHIEDFEDFPDGSYLEKFDTVTYDLSSYFSDREE